MGYFSSKPNYTHPSSIVHRRPQPRSPTGEIPHYPIVVAPGYGGYHGLASQPGGLRRIAQIQRLAERAWHVAGAGHARGEGAEQEEMAEGLFERRVVADAPVYRI